MTVGDTAVQLHFVLPKGEDGYTPERGVDYWTQEDKNAISNDLTDFVNSANVSIQYAVQTAAAARAEANAATDAANAAIADLQAKADAGDFNGAKGDKGEKGDKGDKGDKGEQGAPGYTPVKGLDYWTPTEEAAMDAAKTAANNAADNASVAEAAASYAASMADEAASSASISAQNADAAAGEARAKAAELQAKADAGDFDGADGYTPVRGTDYWTDADKAAINADIAAQLAGKVDKIDGKGLSTNDYTDADKAAVVLLGKNVTLLKEITTTEEASVIVLLDNVKIRNFFVEAEIAKAAANTSGQLILNYTDGSSVYCTIKESFNSARAIKSSYIGYDIHGMQPILCRNQSTSGIAGTYATIASFHYGNNTVSKIRYHSTESIVVPIGSKFTVYGILED